MVQPPLTQNPLLGYLTNIFTFGGLLLTGFIAGSIGGLIHKLKGRPFPWRRILWASLVIAAVFAALLTLGAWYAHGVVAR